MEAWGASATRQRATGASDSAHRAPVGSPGESGGRDRTGDWRPRAAGSAGRRRMRGVRPRDGIGRWLETAAGGWRGSGAGPRQIAAPGITTAGPLAGR
jgi:hypothetical protein